DPAKYLAGNREAMEIAAPATRYVCPMHPDVVSVRPGSCPKCGMALEPAAPTLDSAPDPELLDMSRRFWVGIVLGVPVFLAAMLDMLPAKPVTKLLGESGALLFQAVLSTPVVLWCGWPFYVRAWESWKNRSANMFTLIALGVGAAYLYSLVVFVDHV